MCKDLLLTHKEEQVKSIKDSNKDTALHIACRKGEGDIVKLLVDSGALVDVQNVSTLINKFTTFLCKIMSTLLIGRES